MDGKLQHLLNTLPEKPPRSRLEVYRELIDELRRRKWTYRDIARVLAEKCQQHVSVSTLHDFVRLRSLGKKTPTKRIPTDGARAAASAPKGGLAGFDQEPANDEEVRRRIAALKARRPAATQPPNEIDYDPTQPLRLITRTKPAPDK